MLGLGHVEQRRCGLLAEATQEMHDSNPDQKYNVHSSLQQNDYVSSRLVGDLLGIGRLTARQPSGAALHGAALVKVRPRQQHRPRMPLGGRKRRLVALLGGLEPGREEGGLPVERGAVDGCDLCVMVSGPTIVKKY